MTPFLAFALLPMAAEPSLADLGEQALHLRYAGSLKSIARDGTTSVVKSYSVFASVVSTEDGGWNFRWATDETGGGSFAWPERFGEFSVSAAGKLTGTRVPRVMQEYQDSEYILGLWTPKFALPKDAKIGNAWADGLLRYSLIKQEKIGSRDCYRIAYSHPRARHGTLWVRVSDGLLVKAERREFLGRGDRFTMTLQLGTAEIAKEEAATKTTAVFDKLLEVQKSLDRKPDVLHPELSDKQLAVVSAAIKQLKADAAKVPVEFLVSSIDKDLKSQSNRANDLAALGKKFIGKKAPAINLAAPNGAPIAIDKKKILLLHFWKYRDKPLKEPYGQVGYLEFLNNRAKKRRYNLQVVGVAVDPRFGNAGTRSAAARSVQKLREFFNLSYPVAADRGTLLKTFGDPRRFGAKLPLWVLIAPDGTVRHYHAGHYKIDTRKGLEQLETAVVKVVKELRK